MEKDLTNMEPFEVISDVYSLPFKFYAWQSFSTLDIRNLILSMPIFWSVAVAFFSVRYGFQPLFIPVFALLSPIGMLLGLCLRAMYMRLLILNPAMKDAYLGARTATVTEDKVIFELQSGFKIEHPLALTHHISQNDKSFQFFITPSTFHYLPKLALDQEQVDRLTLFFENRVGTVTKQTSRYTEYKVNSLGLKN